MPGGTRRETEGVVTVYVRYTVGALPAAACVTLDKVDDLGNADHLMPERAVVVYRVSTASVVSFCAVQGYGAMGCHLVVLFALVLRGPLVAVVRSLSVPLAAGPELDFARAFALLRPGVVASARVSVLGVSRAAGRVPVSAVVRRALVALAAVASARVLAVFMCRFRFLLPAVSSMMFVETVMVMSDEMMVVVTIWWRTARRWCSRVLVSSVVGVTWVDVASAVGLVFRLRVRGGPLSLQGPRFLAFGRLLLSEVSLWTPLPVCSSTFWQSREVIAEIIDVVVMFTRDFVTLTSSESVMSAMVVSVFVSIREMERLLSSFSCLSALLALLLRSLCSLTGLFPCLSANYGLLVGRVALASCPRVGCLFVVPIVCLHAPGVRNSGCQNGTYSPRWYVV